MAVRNVVTPSGRRVRGYFPSRKMGRLIAWESQLERDAILLLEFSPGVLRYREQPERVHFQLDGDAALYIPDFELELADGQMMHVEVKPAAKLEKPDIALRFEAIARHYARIGRGLRILTEAHIRRTPLLQTCSCLPTTWDVTIKPSSGACWTPSGDRQLKPSTQPLRSLVASSSSIDCLPPAAIAVTSTSRFPPQLPSGPT